MLSHLAQSTRAKLTLLKTRGVAARGVTLDVREVRDTMQGVTPSRGQRRIDRVLAPDYLADLPAQSMETVRARRRDAEQEETDLSYLRRLLQGRIDILRAELARRSGDGAAAAEATLAAGGGDASLVERLTSILTDDNEPSPTHGLGRHITVEPSRADQHRRHVESLIADVDLSDPAQHSKESLDEVLAALQREEHNVSEQRRAVQAVMDACTLPTETA